MITFQRYNTKYRTKNTTPIKFTTGLDFASLSDKDLTKETSVYSLIGISNHSGSMNFGHYFAFCRDNYGQWYECNDSFISKTTSISNSAINSSSTAYVLLYERNK